LGDLLIGKQEGIDGHCLFNNLILNNLRTNIGEFNRAFGKHQLIAHYFHGLGSSLFRLFVLLRAGKQPNKKNTD